MNKITISRILAYLFLPLLFFSCKENESKDGTEPPPLYPLISVHLSVESPDGRNLVEEYKAEHGVDCVPVKGIIEWDSYNLKDYPKSPQTIIIEELDIVSKEDSCYLSFDFNINNGLDLPGATSGTASSKIIIPALLGDKKVSISMGWTILGKDFYPSRELQYKSVIFNGNQVIDTGIAAYSPISVKVLSE